jgi:hypothetical protein
MLRRSADAAQGFRFVDLGGGQEHPGQFLALVLARVREPPGRPQQAS